MDNAQGDHAKLVHEISELQQTVNLSYEISRTTDDDSSNIKDKKIIQLIEKFKSIQVDIY